MALDNIDENFKKVATGFNNKNKKTKPVDSSASISSAEEKSSYESSFEGEKASGILSIFEEHLRKQVNSKKSETESDEEFRTIDVHEKNLTTTAHTIEKVTEDEIQSLVNNNPNKTIISKDENKVTSIPPNSATRRYDETIKVTENVASVDDLKVTYTSSANTARYTDETPVTEIQATSNDKEVGLAPVNVTKKKSNNVPTDEELNPQAVDKLEPSNDTSSDLNLVDSEKYDSVEHYNKVRRENLKRNLPEGYILDEKN